MMSLRRFKWVIIPNARRVGQGKYRIDLTVGPKQFQALFYKSNRDVVMSIWTPMVETDYTNDAVWLYYS